MLFAIICPLLLRHRALQGRLLFEREPIAVANLIEDTLRRYRDFAPRLREGRAAYYESLEQDYGSESWPVGRISVKEAL